MPSSVAAAAIMTISQKLSWASGQWYLRRRSVTRTISVVMWRVVETVGRRGGRGRRACLEDRSTLCVFPKDGALSRSSELGGGESFGNALGAGRSLLLIEGAPVLDVARLLRCNCTKISALVSTRPWLFFTARGLWLVAQCAAPTGINAAGSSRCTMRWTSAIREISASPPRWMVRARTSYGKQELQKRCDEVVHEGSD